MDFLSDAKKEFSRLSEAIKKVELGTEEYFKILENLIELNIEIKGHAWCMDVRNERRKMARLTTRLLSVI